MAIDDLKLFTGNANPGLSSEVAAQLGIGIGRAVVSTFSDGEANVEIMENVRGSDVYVMQPTCAPASQNLMELLVMIDALRRSSAERITAVLPYFGYRGKIVAPEPLEWQLPQSWSRT
jgi:ribose-phosphate pyrophosphokinase